MYNFWFVVLITYEFFTVCITRKDTKLRHQFLISFMAVWTLGRARCSLLLL